MANEIRIRAVRRQARGSAEARRVRRDGGVPAALNLLSGGTETLRLDAHELEMTLRHLASAQLLVTLDIEGRTVPALLREIQRHVLSGRPLHADFGEVDMTRRIRATLAIRLEGEPEGVRTEGGVLTQMTREVAVECLPADLVDSFAVDVSGLKLGQSLTVADLKLGDRYTLITHGETPVATVTAVAAEEAGPPAAAGEAAAAAAEAAPAAGPEVIAKGKKEEESGS
jgi:large subunit ribosomal protein L25